MIFVGRWPLKPASWTWQMLNWRFILIQSHHLGIFKVESCCHELFSGGKKELGVHHLWEELIHNCSISSQSKSESNLQLLFRHQWNFPKTSHLSVQGKQIDRSWQVIPDGKSWLSKIAIHNLQMGKTESWHIFAVYVEHSTQLNHQFLRRQNLTVSSSVRYLECVAVAVNQQSFKMRHLRIDIDRLFYHLQGELHKLKIRHKVQLTIALGFE